MSLAVNAIDLAVLAAYLIGVVAFGMWAGRGARSLADYLLGDRDLPWWAILGSIVATETSTATFLSVPGIAYAAGGDLRFLQLTFGYVIGRVLIVYLLLPLYFQGDLYTAYEALHRRFGGATKQTAAAIFLVARNLGDGLRLYLAAIALEKVIGAPLWQCVILVGAATIVYTFFGGIRSVVFNDCIQFVVYMVGGAVAGAVIIAKLPGGWEQLTTYAAQNEKFRVFDFAWNISEPLTFWAGLLGGMFLTLGTHGADQIMVQRYLCARSQKAAGAALIASGLVVMAQFALFLLIGVGLACYYEQFPPSSPIGRSDEAFAAFIVNGLPAGVGIIGIVLAAVFAAAMSTLSSSLNSSASSAVNDFYLPLARARPTEQRLLWITRAWTVFFGVVQIGVGIGARRFDENVVTNALAIAGFSAGLLLGVFFLAALTTRVNQRSALFGLVCGAVLLVIVKFEPALAAEYNLPSIPPVAWPWYALIGAATTFACAWLHSLVFSRSALD